MTDMADPRRWFECNDSGARWLIVARDLGEAKHLLRETSAGFGQEALSYEAAEAQGQISWRELSPEEVAKHTRCSREDGNPPIPLSEAALGEMFCSEF